MYTAHLVFIAFAILVTRAASKDSITANLDKDSMHMNTDAVCRSAGFVHKDDLEGKTKTKITEDGPHGSLASNKPASSSSMRPADIVLTVIGVTVGVVVAAVVGYHCYNKRKAD